MRITEELLRPPGVPRWRYACIEQAERFCALHPNGCEPTVEALSALEAEGLDVWWLVRLLPLRRQVEYAVWIADPDDERRALDPARRWLAGESVTIEELMAGAPGAAAAAARAAVREAAEAAEETAAEAAWEEKEEEAAAAEEEASTAVWAAAFASTSARAAERDRQLAWLSAALLEMSK